MYFMIKYMHAPMTKYEKYDKIFLRTGCFFFILVDIFFVKCMLYYCLTSGE